MSNVGNNTWESRDELEWLRGCVTATINQLFRLLRRDRSFLCFPFNGYTVYTHTDWACCIHIRELRVNVAVNQLLRVQSINYYMNTHGVRISGTMKLCVSINTILRFTSRLYGAILQSLSYRYYVVVVVVCELVDSVSVLLCLSTLPL